MKTGLNRRLFLKWANLFGLATWFPAAVVAEPHSAGVPSRDTSSTQSAKPAQPKEPSSPETILLKDYRPKSIYRIPVTQIEKAKHPVIDMHSHPYAKTPQQIDEWLKNMDEVGIQKSMILTMTTGSEFDEIYRNYS